MDLGLSGARVLVAASSRGLGFATARRFSMEGARVAINGRHAAAVEQAAQSIRDETGGDVYPLVGDVSDPDGAERLASGAIEALGGLDILVTNAGCPPPGSFESVPTEAWQRAFDLSVMSAVRLIRALLPHLRQSDPAAILTYDSGSVKPAIATRMPSNRLRIGVSRMTK